MEGVPRKVGVNMGICEGCTYLDEETGMCASHEGCIRADDRDEEGR